MQRCFGGDGIDGREVDRGDGGEVVRGRFEGVDEWAEDYRGDRGHAGDEDESGFGGHDAALGWKLTMDDWLVL